MADKYVAYVGSYTRGESDGIYILDLNPDYAYFEKRDSFKINNPSYLTLSHDEKYLYSNCDEGVASFRILEDGSIELMNKASVNGLRPCYLSVDRKNEYLITAGYHDGKLTVLKLNKDGTIKGVTDEVFMKGLGSIAGRNYRCHVNCAIFSPDEKYIMAVDLGMDQVKIYEFDRQTGKVQLHDILRCDLESGPKHMLFTSDGKYAYLTHENKCYVTKYAYDPENAHFTKMQTLSTLPEKFDGYNSAITLKLTSDNSHLFVTNSGNNSVAVYSINQEDQLMDTVCILPVSGEYPRDLAVMPNDTMIAAVNQEGNSITSFKVNYEKGYIVMTGAPLKLPSPTSIKIKKL
jgi:6-phosphogluconolactonase